jgi:hypothetical protein
VSPIGTRTDAGWILVLTSICGIISVGEVCAPLEVQGTCIRLDSEVDGVFD